MLFISEPLTNGVSLLPGRFLPAGILGSTAVPGKMRTAGARQRGKVRLGFRRKAAANAVFLQVSCSGPGPSGAGIHDNMRILDLGCHTGGIKAQAGRFHSIPICPGFLHYSGR